MCFQHSASSLRYANAGKQEDGKSVLSMEASIAKCYHFGVQYLIATAADMDEMCHLLGEAFSRHDPPAVAMEITSSEFEAMVRLYCHAAALDGLTVIARCESTGKLAGALLTEDAASTPPEGLNRVSGKFQPIFESIGQLYEGVEPAARNDRLHLFLLGVDDSFTGLGIATELVAATMRNGVSRGYRSAMAEATNPLSQRVFRKLGFHDRATGSFGGFLPGGPVLMEKILVAEGSER